MSGNYAERVQPHTRSIIAPPREYSPLLLQHYARAAKMTPYTQEYLSLLARKRIVAARRIGRMYDSRERTVSVSERVAKNSVSSQIVR